MKLAACSAAALGNTPATVAERLPREHPYWSASYDDVCKAVDREMAYRQQLGDQGQRISELEQENERLRLGAHGPDASDSSGGATAGKD